MLEDGCHYCGTKEGTVWIEAIDGGVTCGRCYAEATTLHQEARRKLRDEFLAGGAVVGNKKRRK